MSSLKGKHIPLLITRYFFTHTVLFYQKNGGFRLLFVRETGHIRPMSKKKQPRVYVQTSGSSGVLHPSGLWFPAVRAQRLAGARLVSSVRASPASLGSAVRRRTRLVFFSKTSCCFEELDTAWLLLLLSSPASLHRGSKDLYRVFFFFL